MKKNDLLMWLGIGVAVWYLSKKNLPGTNNSNGLTSTAIGTNSGTPFSGRSFIDNSVPVSSYAARKAQRIAGMKQTLQSQVS